MPEPRLPNNRSVSENMAAQYRLEEMSSHRNVIVHSGNLQLGQLRAAVFKVDTGTLIVGSGSMIHVEVIERAGMKIDEGIYLSGFVQVADDGVLEWLTSGALSSFPPDLTSLPFHQLMDRIRGLGVRIPDDSHR